MTRILTITLFLAGATAVPLHAQQPAPASPAALVEQAEKLKGDDAGALRLVERALPLLRSPADVPARLRALRVQCWASAGTLASADLAALAERGVAEAQRAGDARARADLRVCRGYGREGAGRLNEALADYDFGAAEGRRLNDARLVADGAVLGGELRYYRGDMAAALVRLEEAYRLYTKLGDAGRQRYALNAIANLYADRRVGDYDRAIEYYRQVLASNEAAGEAGGVGTAFYNLGSTLESKGDLAAALAYYRRALEVETRLKDADGAADTRRSIGVVLAKQGKAADALPWLEQAVAYFGHAGDAERLAQARLSRGVALRQLGRWSDALADLDAARARFQAPHNARFLEKIEGERALAFAGAVDWRRAFDARTAQMDLQRELAERLKAEQTSRLSVQFDTRKKDAENRALLRENGLRGQALAAAARAARLQATVIALVLAMVAVLAALVVKHVAGERRMRAMALTDELTRLPNRRHLLALADEGLDAARRDDAPLSVLALDVDHFKRINDTYGHDAGDAVLRRVAQTCRASLREGDSIGRTGGEEFVVVLPATTAAIALDVAERLRTAVERLDWSDVAPALRVTVSVGVAERAPAEGSFGEVSRRADDSLYHAKHAGRNRVALASA
jgi:diguanylate cyclase (GGDEF)-like protein